MEIFMKDNGMRVREMVMEFLQRETVTILKDIGLMIKEKVRARTSIVTRINFLLESGLMISQKLEYTQKLKMKMLTKVLRDHISKIHTYFLQYQN
jgi:hypothetical protein